MIEKSMALTLDAGQTEAALPFEALCLELEKAIVELSENRIVRPARQILPLGPLGTLSSLAATSDDLGVHKLVTYCPRNSDKGMPTISASVTAWSEATGQMVLQLDGASVTTRRTAAMSMVAMKLLSNVVKPQVAILGAGVQAQGHLLALAATYPGASVWICGRSAESVAALCERYRHLDLSINPLRDTAFDGIDVVIAATSARQAIYHEPAQANRLLIGVGAYLPDMAEYAPAVVRNSELYIDDPLGGPNEAGDFIQAGVDWSTVRSLADVMSGGVDLSRARLFKNVGSAAWDLAAARCALLHLR